MEQDGPYISRIVNGFSGKKIYSTNEDAYIDRCYIQLSPDYKTLLISQAKRSS